MFRIFSFNRKPRAPKAPRPSKLIQLNFDSHFGDRDDYAWRG